LLRAQHNLVPLCPSSPAEIDRLTSAKHALDKRLRELLEDADDDVADA